MTDVYDPFVPYGGAPVAKTPREVRHDEMMREALPYLIGLAAWQPSEKLEALIAKFVEETRE